MFESSVEVKRVELRRVQLLMNLHLRAAGCHMGSHSVYLPPDTIEHTPP